MAFAHFLPSFENKSGHAETLDFTGFAGFLPTFPLFLSFNAIKKNKENDNNQRKKVGNWAKRQKTSIYCVDPGSENVRNGAPILISDFA